ncbi:glycosyltransferase [Photobacterium damselae subsp. damselae]|nr:glycosyltransferase [Photobacterium damselae subsp. damselae]
MPISVLEALSYGIPCIVSQGTNMADLVDKYKCGFVVNNQKDYNRLVNRLELMDNNLINIYRQNALNLIRRNYSWKKIATQYEEILGE